MTTQLKNKMFDMEVFGYKNTGMQVQGFEYNNSWPIPTINPEYVFHKDTLVDVVRFVDCSFGEGLMLKGATGCGKTSVIQQTLARLNYPTQLLAVVAQLSLWIWSGNGL
ncbi:hypothetical protein [Psychromonas sp. KJ10-2]|uniref:hypothetical protein n=1 Tax=Psychromonas sp. KJ10-2 TaxID=3391822 RepID=UPI0039B56C05